MIHFPGGSAVTNPPARQETQVPSRIWEDPTCLRAAEPVHHSYSLSLCSRAWDLQLLSLPATATETCEPWSLCSTTREATAMRSLNSN